MSMRRFTAMMALATALLSMNVVLAAEQPTSGGTPSAASVTLSHQKTRKSNKAATAMTKKPRAAKMKKSMPARVPKKAQEKVGSTTTSAPTTTPATSATSTQR